MSWVAAQQKKCSIQGCGKWEFEKHAQLCRPCMGKFPQVAAAVAKHRDTAPIKGNLCVRQAIASEHYLGVAAGDRVDVLDILGDDVSVICRTADGTIGFFNLDFLATDEEVRAGMCMCICVCVCCFRVFCSCV